MDQVRYIVEGGIFSDTTWTTVEVPEFYGPFDKNQKVQKSVDSEHFYKEIR